MALGYSSQAANVSHLTAESINGIRNVVLQSGVSHVLPLFNDGGGIVKNAAISQPAGTYISALTVVCTGDLVAASTLTVSVGTEAGATAVTEANDIIPEETITGSTFAANAVHQTTPPGGYISSPERTAYINVQTTANQAAGVVLTVRVTFAEL